MSDIARQTGTAGCNSRSTHTLLWQCLMGDIMTSKPIRKTDTLFTKDDLESIPPALWKDIINTRNYQILLKELAYLIDITDNGKKDYAGLSPVDDEWSRVIYEDLKLNPKHGTNLKKSVLLLFKYRAQLARHHINFPDCIFEVENAS